MASGINCGANTENRWAAKFELCREFVIWNLSSICRGNESQSRNIGLSALIRELAIGGHECKASEVSATVHSADQSIRVFTSARPFLASKHSTQTVAPEGEFDELISH
jgi:hypothetical protein